MQIKIYEPETDEILTRADTDNMRLPFDRGWETYLVTDNRGQIDGVYNNYADAVNHRPAVAA